MNNYDVKRDMSDQYSLRGRVFHKIRDDILNGKYKENEELKEGIPHAGPGGTSSAGAGGPCSDHSEPRSFCYRNPGAGCT